MKAYVSALFVLLSSLGSFGQAPDKGKVIAAAERAFEKASKANSMPAPGCAVGVSLAGESVFERAFGRAEMEHSIPNTVSTVFESGSIAKQFAAAALVLLQQDGKLNLDDDVRKYIPELPDYGKPITIRHLLTHTAGLRDWGSVMELTGAGRGNRVITQDIAFDVIVRQKALDFAPGEEHSYSNSGYLLAVVIVERVSGQKFADFTHERLLKPAGMTNTSWRDDYRRIVPGRAQAYFRPGSNGAWRLSMPIMHAHGFNGMLTTIGDLTKWNAALDEGVLGAPLVTAMETRGVLNNGRKITYALGVYVSERNGVRQIRHGGETSGYRTSLARFPEKKLSIAVLCNGSTFEPWSLTDDLADGIFRTAVDSDKDPSGIKLSAEELNNYVGVWRDEKTRMPLRFAVVDGSLSFNGAHLTPVGPNAFTYNNGNSRVEFTADDAGRPVAAREIDENGLIYPFYRETEWKPTVEDLGSFAGNWQSEEAEASVRITFEGERAYFAISPVAKFQMIPVYKDYFLARGYGVWFDRDAFGKVIGMHIGGSRMRDMPFRRIK